MLQFHPHQRLCIADLVGHPWLSSGNSATAEQIRTEFTTRNYENKYRALQELERKAAMRN